MTLVTPALGTLRLSRDRDPELFKMARVGLGCLGVVAEVTLQCVPAHRLVEHTSVESVKQVRVGGGRMGVWAGARGCWGCPPAG